MYFFCRGYKRADGQFQVTTRNVRNHLKLEEMQKEKVFIEYWALLFTVLGVLIWVLSHF